jgi:hypothetical protein
VVASLYSARAAGIPLNTAQVLAEVQATVPLSVTMAEQLARLRAWCHERAVPAN